MNGLFIRRLLIFAAYAAFIFSLQSCNTQESKLVTDSGVVAYNDSTAEYPRLVFADGQISLNDHCMVRMVKLNRKMPPIYVNGKPVGFC